MPESVALLYMPVTLHHEFLEGSRDAVRPPRPSATRKPLEVSMWYDIRLHNPKMLRLATRMIGTAERVRIR